MVSVLVVVLVTYFAKKAIDEEMKLQKEAKRKLRREARDRIVTHVEAIEGQ